MRLMSFSLTTEQVERREKTVTRRLGWKNLRPGTRLRAVHKVMGFKPGEHPRDLAVIEVVDVREEPIGAISAEDVAREGFSAWSPEAFVAMFCEHNGCSPSTPVRRIEFRYVEGGGAP